MSSQPVIARLDGQDSGAVDAAYATYSAADRHGLESLAVTWSRDEVGLRLVTEDPTEDVAWYVGTVAGRVVVVGTVETPLLDNLDSIWIAVYTHPDHRRGGLGTAMLAHLEALARGAGRTQLVGESCYPLEPADGTGWPGPEFAAHHGYTLGIGDIQRQLALPVDPDLLTRLRSQAEERHRDYTIRAWEGPVPDDVVDSFVELAATLSTQAPTGDLELEDEVLSVADFRVKEDFLIRSGGQFYGAVALDRGGRVAGLCRLRSGVTEPLRLYQWETIVSPADRGHRLGMAVKIASLEFVQQHRPEVTHILTYNAEVNRHMIAVNQALGFVPTARLGEFVKRQTPS